MAQLESGVMGFEQGYVTWQLHREVSDRLKESTIPVTLEPLEDMVESMRVIKDGEEIDAIEASARMMSGILDRVIPDLEPGLTEADVAWTIRNLAREAGADDLSFPSIVASGPNGALTACRAHGAQASVRRADCPGCGREIGGILLGHDANGIFGGAVPRVQKDLQNGQDGSIGRNGEIGGVKSGRVWKAPARTTVARDVIADAGYGAFFGHSLGHGVGLATHEQPRLSPQKPVELKKGMVVTVEPGIYLPGEGGVRLEEMVVVEEDGARLLTCNQGRDFSVTFLGGWRENCHPIRCRHGRVDRSIYGLPPGGTGAFQTIPFRRYSRDLAKFTDLSRESEDFPLCMSPGASWTIMCAV